jgi:MarR family transcriptional regulator, lower aerobic nicotinate degradation pathway regulator
MSGAQKLPAVAESNLLKAEIMIADEEVDYRVEEQVGFLMRKTHQRATAIFQSEFNEDQITPTQFSALVKLRDEGEVSQNHLGRMTAMDPATIQGVIRRLTDRGFIETKADVNDKRRMLLSLSTSGQVLTKRLVQKGKRVTTETLAPLNAEEQIVLLGLLTKIS